MSEDTSLGLSKKPVTPKSPYKFDDDSMSRFLNNYMLTGQINTSCRAAGISEETVRRYIRDNSNGFADLFAEAKGMFRDMIETEIQRRAIEGIDEPIIGGKDRDQVVVTVKRYSDRLLEFLAKRHIPEYREKQQLDVNVAGGVMVVPAITKTDDDWSGEYDDLKRPVTIEHNSEEK